MFENFSSVRILFDTCFSLAQALRTVGHRARLATHETFRSFVRNNGIEFYPIAGDPADIMSFMIDNVSIIPSMKNIVDGNIDEKRRSLANILISTWHACTAPDDETNASFTAEAIIATPTSFGHIHCAEKLQIPLHIMFTIPWSPTTAFPHPLSNVEHSIGPKNKINFYSYDVIELLVGI
jgi:sterol 3beta-glucosyltransferase